MEQKKTLQECVNETTCVKQEFEAWHFVTGARWWCSSIYTEAYEIFEQEDSIAQKGGTMDDLMKRLAYWILYTACEQKLESWT